MGTSTNKKLVLQFNCGAGQIRANLNIHNHSQQATEIALRQLKSFLVAAGHPNPDKPGDVDTLTGLQVGIIVGDGKEYTNKDGKRVTPTEIKKYFEPSKFDDIVVQASPPRGNAASAQAAHDKALMDDDIPF